MESSLARDQDVTHSANHFTRRARRQKGYPFRELPKDRRQ
jgi:hypothetical protein